MARPLIIASNRGPVSFEPDEDGELVPKRGGGGLVTALTGALQLTGGLWIACALADGDREQVARSQDGVIEFSDEDVKYDLRYLDPDPETFERYYNVISNRVLWFFQHLLWDTVHSPRFGPGTRQAWNDYRAVNEQFADALAEAGRGREPAPTYLVQDYHLYLVPSMLRERDPNALIGHFSHTPFAGTAYLRILPAAMGEGLLRGMLGADVLGFQAEAWAENFLLCCRTLDGVNVDLRRRVVRIDGREVRVKVYPISVDTDELKGFAKTPEVRHARRELTRWRGDQRLILRVDRTELSKNILRGFLGFEAFLKQHQEWRGRARLLALLNPSRRAIPEYRAYTRECLAAVERINKELGDEEWTPIEVRIKDDRPGAVAAYGLYDVLVVNPVFDGMNLVAMEGPTVNRNHGVLILSRNTGAFPILGKHALGVNPFDIQEMAEALYEAVTMSEDDRAGRSRGLRRAIHANPLSRWVSRQIEDLERAAAARDR